MIKIGASYYWNALEPVDIKTCNFYKDKSYVKVDSKAQYLARIAKNNRVPGSIVTFLSPKIGVTIPAQGYLISTFPAQLVNFDIKYYSFVDGVDDINFIELKFSSEVDLSITGKGTLIDPIVLVNDVDLPGPEKFYGTNGIGEKGWQPVPIHHPATTINVNSQDILSIGEDQVLSIVLTDYVKNTDFLAHTHYQLYQPNGTNPFVYTTNSEKLFVDGDLQSSTLNVTSLVGTGTRIATVGATTGTIGVINNQADGTFLALVSGAPQWTTSIPTIKLSTGATVEYYWKCTNNDGSGGWFPIAASQVYKGTIDGSTGIPTGEVTALIDGSGGATGWYYRCVSAGTHDYGNPSGNSITLAIGDDIYYNGSIWQKIPGQGYTLQPATSTILGGVKIGNGITVQLDGTISHSIGSWVAKTDLTGATVISNLSVDSYGHPTNWTTRTLTPANIGAETAFSKYNVTAGSTKITLGGSPNNSVLSAFSIDVNEANLSLNNINGVLNVAKGGTGLNYLGTTLQLLRVNASATGLEYWSPTYISGNQNITWSASGDISGTASGTTTISPSLTVNAIKTKTVPTLAQGYFYYDITTGWTFKNDTYSIDGHTHSQYLTDAPSNGTFYGRQDGAWTAIAAAQNNYPTSIDFNELTGDFTLARNGLSTLSTSLEGRYSLIHTHPYEPTLGNPAFDGYLLSSSAAGVRQWIPPYTHPTQSTIDTTLLSEASVISRIQINSLGHTTGINTRVLTLGDLGYTGATNANLYVHPSGFTNQPLAALTGANVISQVSVNTEGHVTGITSRGLTLANLGYTGDAAADYYGGWGWQSQDSSGVQIGYQSITKTATAALRAGSNVTLDQVGGVIIVNSSYVNTTYSAGTGLTVSGTTFNHTNSITAGTASEGGINRTLAFGGTFNIPSVTYDATGHIASKGVTTLTMPVNPVVGYTLDGSGSTNSVNIELLANGVVNDYVNIVGTGSTVVSWDEATQKVTINSTVPSVAATNLGNTPGTSSVLLTSSTGTSTTLTAATDTIAGVMTTTDRTTITNLPNIYQAKDADLTAIAAISDAGVGLLRKTAANTWSLDGNSYITGINSTMVTTALGFTPYSNTNPAGYITSAALSGYATQLWVLGLGYDNYGYWNIGSEGSYSSVTTTNNVNFKGAGSTSIGRATAGGTHTMTISSSDTNYYPNAMSFNTTTGVFSLSGTGVNLTQNLDGRYSLIGHTHAYDNYGSWNLLINGGTSSAITSGASANFIAGSNISLSKTGNDVTINMPSTSSVTNGSGTPVTSGAVYTYLLNYAALSGAAFTGAVTSTSTFQANNFLLNSDRRLKDNIESIDTSHKEIRFVKFNALSNPKELRYGVIAQELEEVSPELVRTNEDGMKSVAYIDLLIMKIAELEARIKKLEND